MVVEYSVILTDIEGTTTPISFVHDILFPYVLANVEIFLDENWDDEETQESIRLLKDQADEDVKKGLEGAVAIPELQNSKAVKEKIAESVRWQVENDFKVTALKRFQGLLWKSGYEKCELKGTVWEDVVEALKKWKLAGLKVFVYSSGSILAQKLIFGHSDHGNLLEYFDGYFDTTIGGKLEKNSYVDIAKEIGHSPSDILFVSDNPREVEAAFNAGYQVKIAVRPGNNPIDTATLEKYGYVTSFKDFFQ